MERSPLHERLVDAFGQRSYRELGDITGVHPENVRRYMQGQAPSVEFLAALCAKAGLSAEWLLTGRGPMRAGDIKREALREASGADLLNAMATTIERLHERLDRLEVYTQTLETRVRHQNGAVAHGGASEAVGGGAGGPPIGGARAPGGPSAERGAVNIRAAGVADALAKRPRADAG